VPPGKLNPREAAVVEAFERNTYSVVNIVDVTLVGRAGSFEGSVEIPEGNGSGVVWDDAGNIVTNYHVLGNLLRGMSPDLVANPQARRIKAAAVTVIDSRGRNQTFDGYLVGVDRSKDLAVINVQAPPGVLRPVAVGDSDGLRVGQQVLCIGNPFGFDHTLTVGVVSALNRDVTSAGSVIPGGVQVDAAINPGNSGGALLDSAGKLVGINTAIFTPTGTSQGIGFALPSRAVARVVPQLIQSGRVTRPTLGVQVSSPGTAKQLGVKSGAMVQAVQGGSPAAVAGLLPTRRSLGGILAGDVITKITLADGTAVEVAAEAGLNEAIDRISPGETVAIDIVRSKSDKEKENLTVKVTLK